MSYLLKKDLYYTIGKPNKNVNPTLNGSVWVDNQAFDMPLSCVSNVLNNNRWVRWNPTITDAMDYINANRTIPTTIAPRKPNAPIIYPSWWQPDGNIGNIRYTTLLGLDYKTSDTTIFVYHASTGDCLLWFSRCHHGLSNEKLMLMYGKDSDGAVYDVIKRPMTAPTAPYAMRLPRVSLIPKETWRLPITAWETNYSVAAGKHMKDTLPYTYIWNLIKVPYYPVFNNFIGLLLPDGRIYSDPDSTPLPAEYVTHDALIIHCRDHGNVQHNRIQLMIDASVYNAL